MFVYKITNAEFPDQPIYVETSDEAGGVITSFVLVDEPAASWGRLFLGPVNLAIDVVEMDEAEFRALEPFENWE